MVLLKFRTNIEKYAFYSCSGLTSVVFRAGSDITTAWSDDAFPSGNSLWTAYTSGTKAGTYTFSGTTWTQTL
jgi:hypothetical protein